MNEQATVRPLLEANNVTKVYPDGTEALKDVDFHVLEGEIHGLLGENGAGKTTLTKILSGLLPPTKGEIRWKGQPAPFRKPLDALQAGIGMVHQHFALVNPFTALENVALGQEGGGRFSNIRYGQIETKLKQIMSEGGLHAPLDIPVELLPVGVQQRVEILKMLYRDVELLILDEPTAVLTPQEVDELFETLRGFREAGKTIVIITHKLKELLALTDRITVLRQGKTEGTVSTSEATPESLARLMVGREVISEVEIKEAEPGEVVLSVEGVSALNELNTTTVDDISFEVRKGEIFGIAGVEGNGQTELVEVITGMRRALSGRFTIDGQDATGLGPRDLYRLGIGHIPEDRRRVGMVLEFSVLENSILGLQREPEFKGPLRNLSWRKVRAHARQIVDQFDVLAQSMKSPTKSLSGGNQQKLVVGRELSKKPTLIIASQPTRGLDIASTQYIRDLLAQLRDEGIAILLVSAELDEVLQLSDRIGVMFDGKFSGILPRKDANRNNVGLLMGGITENS